jgi:hypothetical protein
LQPLIFTAIQLFQLAHFTIFSEAMDAMAGRSERDVNTLAIWQRLLAAGHQCCQLLADFSGQLGGKIWPPSNFPF